MKDLNELCLGIVCKDGYFKFGTSEKVITDKTEEIPEGTYIKPDFTTLTHQEIADYLEIPVDIWVNYWFDSCGLNIPLVECWEIEDKISRGEIQ